MYESSNYQVFCYLVYHVSNYSGKQRLTIYSTQILQMLKQRSGLSFEFNNVIFIRQLTNKCTLVKVAIRSVQNVRQHEPKNMKIITHANFSYV